MAKRKASPRRRQATKKKPVKRRKGAKSTQAKKPKGRGFLMVEHAMLQCPRFAELSVTAKAVLLDAMRQYSGFNNGDLQLGLRFFRTIRVGKNRGYAAVAELTEAGFLVMTRRTTQRSGRMTRLYALTCFGVDSTWNTKDAPKSTVPMRSYEGAWNNEDTNKRRDEFITLSTFRPERPKSARKSSRKGRTKKPPSARPAPCSPKRGSKKSHSVHKTGTQKRHSVPETGNSLPQRPRNREQGCHSVPETGISNIDKDLLQRGVSLKGHTPTSCRYPPEGRAAGGQAPATNTAAAAGNEKAPTAKHLQQMRSLMELVLAGANEAREQINGRSVTKLGSAAIDALQAVCPKFNDRSTAMMFAVLLAGLSPAEAREFVAKYQPGLELRIDGMGGAFDEWWETVDYEYLTRGAP